MTAIEPSAPVLEVRGLTKRFPAGGFRHRRFVHALTDADFSLAEGEVVALVGESGSGKSTTVRLIARLMPPTAGEIRLDGVDVLASERKPSKGFRRQVQMIFQDPFGSLNPVHPIRHHLERPLLIHGQATKANLDAKVIELLEVVGLTPAADIADRFPHELSGGQRQRVAIARALSVDPRVILADEPISMLDVSIRMGVLNLIERLKTERRIAFLYITHDLASARYVADRTIVMYAGHMVEGAESSELMVSPAHPYTQLLIAAVPDPLAEEKSIQARGEVPSLVDPGPGCPFAARCPKVMAVCRESMPGRTHVSDGHWVRCHLAGPGEQVPRG
jgi:peptide/nickel transport system ATP-binding protein